MKKYLLTSLISTIGLLSLVSQANALTFSFNFDNTFDDTISEPFVGTGTFRFDGDPGDGTFDLESLPNFDFDFNFENGLIFSNEDIVTPLEEVLVIVSSTENERRVQFSNINPVGSTILFGSIDFIDFDNQIALSFEPPAFGGNLNTYAAFAGQNQTLGTYKGVAVPEFNSNLSLLGLGVLGVSLQFFQNWKSKNRLNLK